MRLDGTARRSEVCTKTRLDSTRLSSALFRVGDLGHVYAVMRTTRCIYRKREHERKDKKQNCMHSTGCCISNGVRGAARWWLAAF